MWVPEVVDDVPIHQFTLTPGRYVLAAKPAGGWLYIEFSIAIHGIIVQNLKAVGLKGSCANKQITNGALEPESLGSWSASNIEEVVLQNWEKEVVLAYRKLTRLSKCG